MKERKQNLKLILKIISDYKTEWIEAINEDFGHRSKDETLLMELMQAQDLIKFGIIILSAKLTKTVLRSNSGVFCLSELPFSLEQEMTTNIKIKYFKNLFIFIF